MKFKMLVCLGLVSLLSGCVSGYRGLVPGKDVHLKNFKQEITTPWGHTLLSADELDTIVSANGVPVVPVVTPVPPITLAPVK